MADLGAGIRQLDSSWQALRQRWEITRPLWNDAVTRDFERDLWALLAAQVPATQQELAKLADVIGKAQRNVK